MERLKQGQWVSFDVAPVKGVGTICGIANTGIPGLGAGYIVHVHYVETECDYAYTHFVVFERYITETLNHPPKLGGNLTKFAPKENKSAA